MYVDVHAHLDVEEFREDLPEVIQRAEDAGVRLIVANGTNVKSNRAVLHLARKYTVIRAALGFYPLEIVKSSVQEIEEELEFIKKHKDDIVAIGEVGLDLYWDKSPTNFEKQKTFFIKIIELANKIQKPIIVHSRKAELETIEILEEHSACPVILHSYGGKHKYVDRCVERGWYFTVAANIERSESLQGLVQRVPSDLLLTETDCPYLAPVKGERSEPKDVVLAARKIAQIKGVEEVEMRNILFMNAQRLFY
ncbi:TatD family deoxyribonuclease [Candidatus Woesearchaeota archaeon]|nr:MAG: TatD family deoxyribonuclease [Candidatus Woesearchaeota archaeon]